MTRKKVLKKIIHGIKKNRANVFSSERGLKGYSVGSLKFPATQEGFERAMMKATVGKSVNYLY